MPGEVSLAHHGVRYLTEWWARVEAQQWSEPRAEVFEELSVTWEELRAQEEHLAQQREALTASQEALEEER